MSPERAIRLSVRTLAWAYGIVLIVIGLDKVTQMHLITDWLKYVSPLALAVIPVSANTLVTVLGVAEILVGILIFFFRRAMAYVVIVVLAVIIVNLIDLGMYDIAARDFLIGLGALVVTWLDQVRYA
jgi:hypothetical protein